MEKLLLRKWALPGLLVMSIGLCMSSAYATVQLSGQNATPESIARIANGESVSVTPQAVQRVRQAHETLLAAARGGQKIYGLTVGVGLNKDRAMVDIHGQLSQEVIDASRQFNVGLIHAHSGGVGPDMGVPQTRAAMAARLNMLLNGGGGVQESIINAYVHFLNKGITPAIPEGGSIGEGDITILSHVGLAMLGEGEVYYQGRKIPAAEALKITGMTPIQPYGKDALSILSSNAYSAGLAALALDEMGHLLADYKLVYALSLQAFNGNVSPFLTDTLALRPFPQTVRVGGELRTMLNGSSIWNHDANRALQDPLSLRSGVYLLGELDRSYRSSREQLLVQLNSSDDNPGVAINVSPKSTRDQEKQGYLAKGNGAVLPSANFDPLPWVLALEEMQLALGHNSLGSAQRVVRLNDSGMTGLTRFLGTDNTVHAFGAMEKPVMAMAMENKALARPVSMDYLPVAGGIEDVATNALSVTQRLQKQIDNSYTLLGIELIHAAQAIDLRQQAQPGFTLSPATKKLYTALRQKVKFMDVDRPLAPDFRAAAVVLRDYRQ